MRVDRSRRHTVSNASRYASRAEDMADAFRFGKVARAMARDIKMQQRREEYERRQIRRER